MNELDEYLKDKIKSGYVYFVYSDVLNKIYVGESVSEKRINIYKSIIEEEDNYNRIRLFNYYTKTINTELLEDIVNRNNNFKIIKIETKYHKHLERSYIRYFYEGKYQLYNKHLYKNHKYLDIEIDNSIIELIIENLEPVNRKKSTYSQLYDSSVMSYGQRIYLGEGLWIDKDDNIFDDCY